MVAAGASLETTVVAFFAKKAENRERQMSFKVPGAFSAIIRG
jgi:hypothetical protein